MNAENSQNAPVMVGADLAEFAEIVGRILGQIENSVCFNQTRFLCHPALWEKGNFAGVVNRNGTWPAGTLTWALPTGFGEYYCEPDEILDFFDNSETTVDFCEKLHRRRLAAAGASRWIDCTGANLVTMASFLESNSESCAISIIGDGRASMYHLFQRGWTPKVAAKSWAVNAAITQSLADETNRVLIVKPEDLIADPVAEMTRIFSFLGSNKIPVFDNNALTDLNSLATEYAGWQTRITPTHVQYLLGMTPKPALENHLGEQKNFTGTELMTAFGFDDIPERDAKTPPQLSKEDQRLIDDFGKFVNPLIDFVKAKPKPVPESEKPPKRRGFFGKKKTEPKPELEPVVVEKIAPIEEPPDPLAGLSDLPAVSGSDGCELAVLIAFWGRHRILEQVVRGLIDARDSAPSLCVVLVCSSVEDHAFAAQLHDEFPCVGVKIAPNQPLGLKWQLGAETCRELGAKNVMITGSDDMVSPSFIQYGLPLMSDYDFIGVASWFLYDIGEASDLQGTLWELAYQVGLQRIPLGAGRIYSARILDKFDWALFDRERRSGLDSQGYLQVVKQGGKVFAMPSDFGAILSVKGGWVALNSTEKILAANTIQADARDFREEEFFQQHFGVSKTEFLARFEITIQ